MTGKCQKKLLKLVFLDNNFNQTQNVKNFVCRKNKCFATKQALYVVSEINLNNNFIRID